MKESFLVQENKPGLCRIKMCLSVPFSYLVLLPSAKHPQVCAVAPIFRLNIPLSPLKIISSRSITSLYCHTLPGQVPVMAGICRPLPDYLGTYSNTYIVVSNHPGVSQPSVPLFLLPFLFLGERGGGELKYLTCIFSHCVYCSASRLKPHVPQDSIHKVCVEREVSMLSGPQAIISGSQTPGLIAHGLSLASQPATCQCHMPHAQMQ